LPHHDAPICAPRNGGADRVELLFPIRADLIFSGKVDMSTDKSTGGMGIVDGTPTGEAESIAEQSK
jgi:hypothetical protein